MRTVLLTRQAVTVAVAAGMAVLGISAPASASPARAHPLLRSAAPTGGPARPALPAGERYVCPDARPGWMTCMSIIRIASLSGLGAVPGGAAPHASAYGPDDLRKAYKIRIASAHNGQGRTVAIVDAFNDPHAAADLSVYRRHFRLPACTKSNGCLHILNEHGKSSPLPANRTNWAMEISLDLDMVSAICPKCHITLIEASNNSDTNLGTAENTAIARGAKYVSNSWGGREFGSEHLLSHYFNHPGNVIDFASGDLGYGPTFPADLQYVTSIGGTSLRRATNARGWTESVWGGTGSGCSAFQAKPSWQRVDVAFPHGCQNRTQNDAAAVADPNTGVVIYDSYGVPRGFYIVGGTSVATPIITAIYALAGAPVRNTYPAEYLYLKSSHVFDVTSGANGTCGVQTYLCHGVPGYDGPSGLGTPNGTAAFTIRAVTRVTVVDPGTQTGTTGAAFTRKIIGLDSRKVTSLRWSAAGLPSGVSITSIPGSTNAKISGTITAPAGTYQVTVTARDGSVAGSTHFNFVVR